MHYGTIMETKKIINKINWCFKIKEGLEIVEPNKNLSKSYLKEAKSSLARAEKNLQDNDLLWCTVIIYYAEYYALYSFLQKIGLKCENHSCSISAVTHLLGKEKTNTINEHKEKRIDAQYYIRTGKKEQVEKSLTKAKEFVSKFDELISNISEKEINTYRNILIGLKDKKK